MTKNDPTQVLEMSQLTKAEADKIALKLETMYHSVAAIYDLSMDAMSTPSEHYLIAIKEMARSCARDLDACAGKLSGSESGFFEGKFGSTS